jgi:hypothetical protein
MFRKVLIKFFTQVGTYENKAATTEDAMLKEVKTVLARSSHTMIEDALGVVTLFVLLIAGLNLPHYL